MFSGYIFYFLTKFYTTEGSDGFYLEMYLRFSQGIVFLDQLS